MRKAFVLCLGRREREIELAERDEGEEVR